MMLQLAHWQVGQAVETPVLSELTTAALAGHSWLWEVCYPAYWPAHMAGLDRMAVGSDVDRWRIGVVAAANVARPCSSRVRC